MKEILYVQAGPFSNFVGTHFWNTQESYFTYDNGEDPAVFHDRSFREGLNRQGQSTYCPRLLLFDRTSNFGALPDELYRDNEVDHDAAAGQWDEEVVEYRQEPIPKSEYHARLEAGELEDHAQDNEEPLEADLTRIRFWSDYSRVFLHPRTPQRLPDLPDWEAVDGDWNKSRDIFQRHESDHDLMENELRSFVEECDGLQGLQLMSDCVTFGGFTDAFLTAFRDEFPKLPSLAFSFLSDASNTQLTAEEPGAAKALNDALCLCSLENLSTLNVPIQHPSTWSGNWLENLTLDLQSPYYTSALVSTHIESATSPLRLKASEHDLASLTTLLNISGTTRTAHLSGIYPLSASMSESDLPIKLYDLSAMTEPRDSTAPTSASEHEYGRLQVIRGNFSSVQWTRLDELFSPPVPASISVHAPAYPTPTSFPRIVGPALPQDLRQNVYSALTTSSAPARLFAAHARLAQECVDRRAEVVARMGLELDEVRELRDELWALCDRYAAADQEGHGGMEERDVVMGEDEEWLVTSQRRH